MHQEIYKKLIIQQIRQETSEVKLFYFNDAALPLIPFKAGQYLTFVFYNNGKELRRSYSIVSSPVLNEYLSIGVKRIRNGIFSRQLFDYAKVGDTLITTGAGGIFTLPDNIQVYKQFFFFAAGSGIVPVYSIIKTILYSMPHLEVILIYSNRSVKETMFYQSLKNLKLDFPHNFHLEFLFSDSRNLLNARLHNERISYFLKKYSIDSFDKSLYYLCGPEAYMRLCSFTLQGLFIPAEHIRKEIFHTNKLIHKAEPPDKRSYNVSIIINQSRHAILVKYPITILQAAKIMELICLIVVKPAGVEIVWHFASVEKYGCHTMKY